MVNYQPLDSFLDKRNKTKEENRKVFPNDEEIAIGGIRNLSAAILVLDIADSSQYSTDDFIQHLSPFLHMVFHLVHENNGVVDKYTGDGAMISFCGKEMTSKDACEYSVKTAYQVANLTAILEKNYDFPKIKVRIGIDYGTIKVERIGVRGKSHLIIVGTTATIAKRLETIGKEVDYDQNTTIMIGYDVYHNFEEVRRGRSKLHSITGDLQNYFADMNSMYTQEKPYTVYKYTGRIPLND